MKKYLFKIIQFVGIIDVVMIIIGAMLYFLNIANLTSILPILISILVLITVIKQLMGKSI